MEAVENGLMRKAGRTWFDLYSYGLTRVSPCVERAGDARLRRFSAQALVQYA